MTAKLYWAGSKDSAEWHGPVSEIVEAKLDALVSGYDVAIWVAPVDAELDDDDAFWAAIAQWILWDLDRVEERLAEEGWTDPDQGWLADYSIEDARGELADALRKVFPPRPVWRTVDTAKAERVEL